MSKRGETTITIDAAVLQAVEARAARTGMDPSRVIEEAVRRDLGLDLVDRLWDRAELSPKEALRLAMEAQHETRKHH